MFSSIPGLYPWDAKCQCYKQNVFWRGTSLMIHRLRLHTPRGTRSHTLQPTAWMPQQRFSTAKKKKSILGDKDSQCLPDGNNGISSYSYNKVFFYNTHFSYASVMEFWWIQKIILKYKKINNIKYLWDFHIERIPSLKLSLCQIGRLKSIKPC